MKEGGEEDEESVGGGEDGNGGIGGGKEDVDGVDDRDGDGEEEESERVVSERSELAIEDDLL